MENKENRVRHYSGLIWLLMTEYNKKNGYTPSKYILDLVEPKLQTASSGLPVEVLDSTLYDFRVTSGFNQYLDLFYDTALKFQNALIILSYTDEKYIVRDFYMANLAKSYTCWDTAYVNCSKPEKVKTKVFDYILTPEDLPTKLTEIIRK